MRISFIFSCLVLYTNVFAQIFSEANVKRVLDDLNEKESVAYVNRHFYAIYSESYDNAKKLTNWAALTSSKNGWKKEQGYALMNYGIVTYLKGEYDISLPAFLRSNELFDSLGHDAGKAMLYAEMANYYQKMGHKKKSYALLDSSEILCHRINDYGKLAKTYGMRATFLYRDGQIEEAREYYNKNYQINLKRKDSVGLGYALLDQALYAQLDGDLNQALKFIDQSTTIRTRIKDQQALAENLDFLGDTYLRAQKYNEAIRAYKECVDLAKKVNYPDQLRKAYSQIVKVYQAMGEFESALYYLDSSYLLKDSLFNIQRTRTIEEFQTKYETEKKEQLLITKDLTLAEQSTTIQRNNFLVGGLILVAMSIVVIAFLLRSRLRKKQEFELQQRELDYRAEQLNAVIDSQEKERKRFATDLHDGFGQLISVLKMNVAAIKKEDATPKRKDELFDKSTEILNGMFDELRGICFNLMPHTLVQEGLVLALEEFAGRINLSGKVTVEILIFDFEERLDDLKEISIYRIVQEWVNNILKYGDAKLITIQLTKDEQEITLTVEDNGQGFDKDLLFNSKGNGWKNINSRTNLIKGVLDVDTNLGLTGSMLILNIPHKIAVGKEEKVS